MKKTLLITGGHLAPALAVIEEVKKTRDWEIAWVGRKFAMEGQTTPSLEYQTIPKLGIPFHSIETGRLQRRWTKYSIPSLLRIPLGFFQSLFLLFRTRPNVVLSFGGYLSLPVVISGWMLQTPIVLHEQTTTSGFANRIASWFVNKVAISYPSSSIDFPHQKTVLVGNPVRRDILNAKRRPTRRPLIFITGGSQGSQTVNDTVSKILSKLLATFDMVHQTGFLDYERFSNKKKKGYQVFATIHPDKIAKILSRAWLVISRAGANTVTEIASVGVPAIFIPIPWSERGEQEKNARFLSNTGLARVLHQDSLTPNLLFKTIKAMVASPPSPKSVRQARKLVHKNAAKDLVALVARFME